MNNRTYERFIPQENNVNDPIQAEDINELQRTLEKTQQELFVQADDAFLMKALFTLGQHPDVNAMFVDQMTDDTHFNLSTAANVSYNTETKSLELDVPGQYQGSITTKVLPNETGKSYKKIVLLADEYKPVGSSIEYYISFDNVSYVQVQPNQPIPAVTSNEQAQIYVKIRFFRNDGTVVPRLDAWALLYEDETYSFRFLDTGLDIGIESDWDGTIIK